MYQNEFGKKIKKLRTEKNLTQEDLAFSINVTPQAISKFECGKCYPDVTLIPELARILDVDVNYLFGFVKKNFVFSKTKNDLNLVHEAFNTACYSNNKVEKIENDVVYFTDGSNANLKTKTIENKGQFKIEFSFEEEIIEDNSIDTKNYVFENVSLLDLEIFKEKTSISYSKDEYTYVEIKGEKSFLEIVEISLKENKLKLRHSNTSSKSKSTNIELDIKIPKNQEVSLYCNIIESGVVNSKIDYYNKALINISRSGVVDIKDSSEVQVSINGSGVVSGLNSNKGVISIYGSGVSKFKDIESLTSNIYGSGDITVDNTKTYKAFIAGNGNIKCLNCFDFNIGSTGCGECILSNIEDDGNITISSTGSSDIIIKNGNCKNIKANLSGKSVVNCEGVTCEFADIKVCDKSEIVIGKVIEKSIEQYKNNGYIKIIKRGN